jgi:N-acetyl-anhydromuramyl-L-alanine amidase AmpD
MANAPTIHNVGADYWTDRAGLPVVAIVVHGTGGTNSLTTLQHGDGRGVSIHTLHPKNGDIFRLVPDERGANHAGAATSTFTLNGQTYKGARVNRATLGLELENLQDGRDPYTEAQLLSMGWQIGQWRRRYGNLPVLRHADLDPTRRRDPYQLTTNQIEEWTARAATVFAPPPVARRYRALGVPVYQAQSCVGPLWGHLEPEEIVEVDVVYPEGTGHLKDGRGFVRLHDDSLEAL